MEIQYNESGFSNQWEKINFLKTIVDFTYFVLFLIVVKYT